MPAPVPFSLITVAHWLLVGPIVRVCQSALKVFEPEVPLQLLLHVNGTG